MRPSRYWLDFFASVMSRERQWPVYLKRESCLLKIVHVIDKVASSFG